MFLAELFERDFDAEGRACFDVDPADAEQPVDLRLRVAVDGLVGGDAVFVQPARLVPRIIDHDVMALHRQPVRAGEARGAGADDADGFAGGSGAVERVPVMAHHPVGGEALQAPDLNRFPFRRLAHAGLFAERFGRADAGAHAPEDVLLQDRFARAIGVPRGDLADEEGDIDRRRTGRHAGRVVAEIAPVGGDGGLMRVQRRMQIREVLGEAVFGQASRGEAWRMRVGHVCALSVSF